MPETVRGRSEERATAATVLSARAVTRLRVIARTAALFAASVGVLVLVGWLLGVRPFIQVLPGQVAMVPNTAIAFLLAGLALWWRAGIETRSSLYASGVAAAACGLLGLLALAEYLSGLAFGIDELLFRDRAGLTGVFPGRMAVLAAVSFVAIGSALLLLNLRSARWATETLALVPGLLALISLTGYAYGVRSLYWIGEYKGMAIHTAVAFLALSIGVLLSGGDRGFARLIVSDTAGGMVARRILPVALGVPLVLGWLRLVGQRAGLYSTEFGRALYAVSNAVVLLAIFWWIAVALMRTDEERKRAEGALEGSERRYRDLVAFAPVGISRSTPGGRFLDVNAAFARLLGYDSPEQMLSLDIGREIFFDPAERARLIAEIDQRGEVAAFEVRMKGRDGSPIGVQVASRVVRDESGGAVYFENFAHDITERKLAEEEHARFAAIVESSDDAIIGKTLDGIVTSWNAGAERLYGYLANEAVGRSILLQVPSDRTDEIAGILERIRQGERVEHLETVRLRKDGTRFDVSLTVSPIRNGAGEVIGASAIARDSTERKRAEERLRKASAYARRLIEASLDPLVTISPEGRITDVNEATIQATGVSREGLVGSRFSDYFTEPDRAEAGYKRVLSEGEVRDYALTLRHVSGRAMDVLYNATIYRDDTGTVQGVFAAARDITERKQAEEAIRRWNAELEERVRQRTAQFEAANEELEAFAYSVSHDLRAPLRAIGGFSQLLEEDYGGRLDAEGHRAIERIVAGTRTMGQLIDDLLKLSRVSRGELHRERVDLSEVARDIAAGYLWLEPDRQVEVLIAPEAVVEGDPRLLRVALENLLGNAFKFTAGRPTARIEFGVDTNGEGPVYFVRDNGAGFDPTYADKLFGAFQRLHTEAEFPGTGIGLATVRRILHRHGGRAWAEGQVDQGATFSFTLGKE